MTKRPPELDEYITRKHREAVEANQADNRPTYDRELDSITTECEQLYERGLRLIETISTEDRQRCRRLYVHKGNLPYYSDKLQQARVRGQLVLVPACLTLIEEVETLRTVLA